MSCILLADPANNRIVSIYDTAFSTSNLYVSPDTSTYFGIADASGVVTPYITGVGSPHGWDFVANADVVSSSAVPEPASLALLAIGMHDTIRRRFAHALKGAAPSD